MNGYAIYAQSYGNERDELITRHAPLVKRIALRLMGRLPSNVQIDDLLQAGMIGLLEALKRFNSAYDTSFKTYAGIRIRGAMLDEVRCGDWTPRSVHRNLRELGEAVGRVESRKGGLATGSEIAAEMGISIDEYYRTLHRSVTAKVLDLDDTNLNAGYEYQPPSPEDGPEEHFENETLRKTLAKMIDKLPERERLAMSLYYGDELKLVEIGMILKLSESRISQILSQARIKLRSYMRDWME